MIEGFKRLALGLSCCAALAGCAGEPESPPGDALAALIEQAPDISREQGPPPVAEQSPEQCAPYAREHSGINIYGDAYTWWNQAAGKFDRGPNPIVGSVMALSGYAGPEHGHVAVVRAVISAREIRVDHANWLDDGSVYLNNPVLDVSANNDWSVVRVWNIPGGNWGSKTYPVEGFIGPAPNGANALVASADARQ
jgi:hypothetical protein